MCKNQSIRVRWKLLATQYVRALCCPPGYSRFIMLFIRLHGLGLVCHVGPIFPGTIGYVVNVALVSPTLYAMDKMIKVCEIFANKIGLLFNLLKSTLLYYNIYDPNTVLYVTLGSTMV